MGMKRERSFYQVENPAPYKRRSKGVPLTVTQKKQVVRAIKSKEEKKFLDTAFNIVAIPSTAGVQLLTLIGQSDQAGGRDGDAIRLESVDFRFNIQCADATNCVRLILFQYLENTAVAVPTASSILLPGASTFMDCFSQYVNYRKNKGFKILKDVTYDMVLGTETGQINGHWNIPIKSRNEITFNPAATTGYNHLGLLYISDSAAVSHPNVFGVSRVFYTDS